MRWTTWPEPNTTLSSVGGIDMLAQKVIPILVLCFLKMLPPYNIKCPVPLQIKKGTGSLMLNGGSI